jgi:hypothetical protein
MDQLYYQALRSLFVTLYDSQGYSGGIRSRSHEGTLLFSFLSVNVLLAFDRRLIRGFLHLEIYGQGCPLFDERGVRFSMYALRLLHRSFNTLTSSLSRRPDPYGLYASFSRHSPTSPLFILPFSFFFLCWEPVSLTGVGLQELISC